MNKDTEKEISRLLEEAEDSKLVAVMDMIDRLQSRQSFESQIDFIRPKLALLRPPRPISFDRLLATPFEDLLVSDAHWLSGTMTIARSSLSLILNEAKRSLSEAQLSELSARMRPHKMSDIKSVCDLGREIWADCAMAVRTSASKQAASKRGIAEQYDNAARMLAVAEHMCPLLDFLPARPMGELTGYQLNAVKTCLAGCEQHSLEFFQSGMQWLLARSFKPMVILGLLIQGRIGTTIAGRIDLAHELACQVLRRQRMALLHFNVEGADLTTVMEDVENAAGSYLSIAERSREFDLTAEHIHQTGEVLRRLIMQILQTAVNDNYLRTINILDDANITDEQVEKVEAEARAVQRIVALAEACGLKSEARALIETASENAAAELRGRYGASADPMMVVDQIRTFESVFGGDQARKLWQEFARRNRSSIKEVAAAATQKATPAQAMIAALNLR